MQEPLLYRIVRPIITGLFFICYRPTIIGRENIPTNGRVVLAGNHTNNFDCLLLMSATNRTIHFLAKDELMQGFKKIIFKNMGIIPVNRKIHDKSALNNAIQTLHQNQVVGIFPEGTFHRLENQIILPFKIGAVKMAHDTNAPLVPFTITGKYRLFNSSLKIEFFDEMEVLSLEDLTSYNKKLENIISKSLRKESD